MYFPWVGMFEQVNLSNVFVHYDDVQFSKGSFTNRVQIKADNREGFKWLTVPLKNLKLGTNINQALVDNDKNWQEQHLEALKKSYSELPFFSEVETIVQRLFNENHETISELSLRSIEIVCEYFGIEAKFAKSSDLDIGGSSTQRVLDIVQHYGGTDYITGHGAKKYFDHELFERNNIKIGYMDYLRLPYSQNLGDFNPHVSILDLIGNLGKQGKNKIISSTKYWKDFIQNGS